MAKKIRPEELSEKELEFLLKDKRRTQRQKRLEAFRKEGRVVQNAAGAPVDELSTEEARMALEFYETPEEKKKASKEKNFGPFFAWCGSFCDCGVGVCDFECSGIVE